MKNLLPVGRIQLHAENGQVRFQLTDGTETYWVELPVEPFLGFAATLYQGMVAEARGSGRASTDRPNHKPVIMPQTFGVGTLALPERPSVVLIADVGTQNEISIAIPASEAQTVGELMQDRAEKLLGGEQV